MPRAIRFDLVALMAPEGPFAQENMVNGRPAVAEKTAEAIKKAHESEEKATAAKGCAAGSGFVCRIQQTCQ